MINWSEKASLLSRWFPFLEFDLPLHGFLYEFLKGHPVYNTPHLDPLVQVFGNANRQLRSFYVLHKAIIKQNLTLLQRKEYLTYVKLAC